MIHIITIGKSNIPNQAKNIGSKEGHVKVDVEKSTNTLETDNISQEKVDKILESKKKSENYFSEPKLEMENGLVKIHRIKEPISEKGSSPEKDFANDFIEDSVLDFEEEFHAKKAEEKKAEQEEKQQTKKQKKAEKKDKKKRHRNIKKLKKEFDLVSETKNNIGMLLAEALKNKYEIRFIGSIIYIYDKKTGYYKQIDKKALKSKTKTWARKNIPEFYKFKAKDFNEAYNLLEIDEKLQTSEIDGSYNKPYVLCKNGVLDLRTMTLLKKSSSYQFVCMVYANYDEKAKGLEFEKFLDFATGGDKKLKKLIQEVMGYVLSNFTNIRKAITFIGPKHTGKSLILDIIRCLANEINCAAINIQDFEKDYHVSKVLKSRLNIASDLPCSPICGQISKFKSITSELDVVTARDPYNPVFSGRGRIKCLFGTNNHFQFKNVDKNDIEAFFDRIIYIPFNHIPDEKTHDDNLKQKLEKEFDYIFTWAMKGLHRLIENNYSFTRSEASEECKVEAIKHYSPLETFFNPCIKETDDEIFEFSSDIKSAFINYCRENGITDYYNIKAFLDEKGIPHHKKRVDENGNQKPSGTPRSVYEGIKIRKKYRHLINNN